MMLFRKKNEDGLLLLDASLMEPTHIQDLRF